MPVVVVLLGLVALVMTSAAVWVLTPVTHQEQAKKALAISWLLVVVGLVVAGLLVWPQLVRNE